MLPKKSITSFINKQINQLLQKGLVLHQQGNLNGALKLYEQILKLQPNHFDALQLLGTIAGQTKNYQQSLDLISKALAINPNHVIGHYNLGQALQELKRFEEALICYSQAITIKPDYAEAYSNRGSVLHELMRFNEALTNFYKAIQINPGLSAKTYNNIGLSLLQLRRLDEAIASYQKAITIQPDYVQAHWNLSLAHLLSGNFKDGWLGYEFRWKNEEIKAIIVTRSFTQPLWLGAEPLKNKTILLYSEQGFGDTIQFCRYVPLVASLGAKVILEVQSPLVKLIAGLEGVNQIISTGDNLPDFDYQCPLLSLPLAFKTELQTIPKFSRYIKSDQDKLARWQLQLGKKTTPRIGIVWSGSLTHSNDHNRSLTLSQLLSYLPSNYEYISLQKEIRDIDQDTLTEHNEIKHFGNILQDFTDTAALCELMDIVLSVDTSVAHLAGALGVPTWVLLPYNPDWRWLLNRADSPWYPSMRLYRQPAIDDWNSVFDKIKSDLASIL